MKAHANLSSALLPGLLLLCLADGAAAAGLAPASQALVLPKDQTMAATPAYAATGFDAGVPVAYASSPALPLGLALDAKTGVISGYPRLPQPATKYTITATGKAGGATAKASATVNIAVKEPCMAETLSPVEEGRRAYLRLNCYSCHGMTGLGGMGPKIAGEGDDVREVVPGGSDEGMPAFKNYLCGNDLNNLVAYVNAMGRKGAPGFVNWWEQTPSR